MGALYRRMTPLVKVFPLLGTCGVEGMFISFDRFAL
jgi:hypothetical protein